MSVMKAMSNQNQKFYCEISGCGEGRGYDRDIIIVALNYAKKESKPRSERAIEFLEDILKNSTASKFYIYFG